MSGGGQDQGGGKGDNHILWVIFLVFFVGGIIWWQFDYQLKQFFIYLRLGEFYLVEFVLRWLPIETEVGIYLDFMKKLTPDNLTWDAASVVSQKAGKYLLAPVLLFLGGMLYFLMSHNIKIQYRKRYNMKLLMSQESANWPQIMPIRELDLVSIDLDEGPWAMAMTPVFFSKKNKILKIKALGRESISAEKEKFEATVIKERAQRVFTTQLGRPFLTIEQMPIHRRALLGAFSARAARDSKSATALLHQISASVGETGKLDFTGTDALWKKYVDIPEVQEFLTVHAYETTLLASALLAARTDGVLSVADFIWLKPLDRPLWYTLSSVGRQTPFVESAGVYAHWLAERALKRPLTVPIVDEAVKALEIAVGEILYQPSQEEKQQLMNAPNQEIS